MSQLKGRLLDDASVADLAETFKVLGDTTRVRILDALARAEVPVCDLADLLGLTQSAVSHQLRLLREHAAREVAPRRPPHLLRRSTTTTSSASSSRASSTCRARHGAGRRPPQRAAALGTSGRRLRPERGA